MRIVPSSGHVREGSLELHALGDLPALSATVVERHLKDCRHCQRESVKIAQLVQALRRIAVRTRPVCEMANPGPD